MTDIIVECPRCNSRWHLSIGSPGVECTCHLYCSSGNKPSDCSMTVYNYTGQLGWPVGSHQNSANEGDDILHRTYYCSTHSKYTYKTPIFIEPDPKWFKKRAPKKFRMLKTR